MQQRQQPQSSPAFVSCVYVLRRSRQGAAIYGAGIGWTRALRFVHYYECARAHEHSHIILSGFVPELRRV